MKDSIIKYIEYLAEAHSFHISLHGASLLNRLDFLAPYNSHECIYCMLVKSSAECWQRCKIGQERAMEKLAEEGAFFGSCYAGVGEFVFPINAFGKTVGMISVGGYVGSKEKRVAFSSSYGFREERLSSLTKEALSENIPDFELVKTLVTPLSAMLTLQVEKNSSETVGAEGLYGKILSILHTAYTRKISVSEIASECHYSPSFISRYFKKKSGMTVNEYLAKIRMEKAEQLLVNTDMRLEEIAASVGFSDTNYFISFFSSYFGKPPKTYRNVNKSSQK